MADKYSVEAAELLSNEALRLPISEAVPIYEQLLATFPTAVGRCYIRFIRKVNDKKGTEGQEETRKAFDFMLSHVGADIASGPVWMEYIAFLTDTMVQAQTTQEESQRMTAVRKAYQRAIITPTHHVEQLWRDYENFENSVSRALAKGLLSEYQQKYNSARAVYRERKKYVDEIDWNMLAVPPSGSYKEELQWMASKRFLAFEKENPQRIDSASSNKRIAFTYEQCLMYLYHYPDIWYDYATWHAKCDSEMLRYAYAELEESRGAIQPAKKVYESLLGDGVNATSLSHIQFIRFLRRTEGVEAARKYFLDARKSPNCTYHVYVAYAKTSFCLDKDAKIAHNVFEAGLKRFMHEPGYILEYADFLSRLNDDRNIRALFERALSSLPPEESIEVWKRFTQFEQTYGDLASMLKVEQRRKEAISRTGEEGSSALESSLHDVVARYSFNDLWPCSSKELDHLAWQEWLLKNINKKVDKSALANGGGFADKVSSGLATSLNTTAKVIYPDTSRMVVYDPRQKSGPAPGLPGTSSTLPAASTFSLATGGTANTPNEILKATPPALLAFIASLPAVEGPLPDVDFVLSVCLQSKIPSSQTGKSGGTSIRVHAGPASTTSDISGSSKTHLNHKPMRDKPGKRKDLDRQDEDDTATVQSNPLPRDAFEIRQLRKARVTGSQTGSASHGSHFLESFLVALADSMNHLLTF
ncbi:hypothetical protein RJ639_042122 [Escallonia herrerae]|uniref:Suppressor of forked domain-containing protein n=1 Tax=Escallonia herrerae TaxID=1293975 RepID=A0AA88WG61_9ASTE|nr:hypothetical protein RJ639_042122 [Escallonia herrerae]